MLAVSTEQQAVTSPYLTTKEAAVYLRISLSTLYKYVHFEKIHPCRVGALLRFRREDLDRLAKGEALAPQTGPSQSTFQAVRTRVRSLKTEYTAACLTYPQKGVR